MYNMYTYDKLHFLQFDLAVVVYNPADPETAVLLTTNKSVLQAKQRKRVNVHESSSKIFVNMSWRLITEMGCLFSSTT